MVAFLQNKLLLAILRLKGEPEFLPQQNSGSHSELSIIDESFKSHPQ